ncbi:MAG: ABC transporter permease subunit [Hyphomicrobiales bacterium]|nr:ABC transporter permease subunit [Hyphomicrobiales bacterium]OQW80792.1 MAG: peptide ABC transporter permease [Proteobacteria bacterium ST_bin15]
MSAHSPASPPAHMQPGSPHQRAWARLKRHKAAMASLVFLCVMTFAAIVGPALQPHDFTRVFTDYVRTPPSLTAYPRPDQIGPAIDRIAARMRTKVERVMVSGERVEVSLTAERPIDRRLTALFERSDLFAAAEAIELSDGGRRLSVSVPIIKRYFLFGTDGNGRDLLARTLIAGRVSLLIGCLATAVALLIGVAYGAIAGYAGGLVDGVMMRIVDILYALPFIFFVIMLVVFLGRNVVLMFLAVGAIEWLDMARIVRGQTLSLKRREFVMAANALGVRPAGVIAQHIIPNTFGVIIVYMTLLVPKVILGESFLSFLGLGVQEPMTSWGVLIAEGARNIEGATWLLVFPALFLVSTLFALNFLGDGLRDALDPRSE